MLLNLTNHPYSQWDDNHKQAANKYGDCIDLPFPPINPDGDEEYIDNLANEYLDKILELKAEQDAEVTVHLMGEMTFSFALVEKLKSNGIPCIASTSERVSQDLGNGQKEITFKFIRFRNY